MTPSLCWAAWPSDAEPDCDLGPRVPGLAESDDGLADRVVQLGGEPGHVGQGVNVTGRDSAGRRRACTRRMNEAYSSFSTDRRRRFGVNLALDAGSPGTIARSGWAGPA